MIYFYMIGTSVMKELTGYHIYTNLVANSSKAVVHCEFFQMKLCKNDICQPVEIC